MTILVHAGERYAQSRIVVKIPASDHGDVVRNPKACLENCCKCPNRKRVVVSENAIRYWPSLKQKAHGFGAHSFAVYVDRRSGHHQRLRVGKASRLECAFIPLESLRAGAVIPATNMGNCSASLVDQMFGCDAARHLIVNPDEVCRQSGQFTIDQDIRQPMALQTKKGLNVAARGRDYQRIQPSPGELRPVTRLRAVILG